MARALLSSVKVGPFELTNRIALAPMTRGRTGSSGLANDFLADYYAQRASAGLIITEGVQISLQGEGWWGAPRIYRPKDSEAWKPVVDAVHARGGRIFCQLWHCGRASHSSFRQTEEDGRGVAPSPIKIEEHEFNFTPVGRVAHEVPRELKTEEVEAIPDQYRHAAQCAKDAGFDGVELHGANGYIIDLFLQSKTNKRTDKYGGSFENRFRLAKECLEAVFTVFPSDRVSIRLGPNGTYNNMGSVDFRESFLDYAARLSMMNLAYLHVVDGLKSGFHELGKPLLLSDIRKVYGGIIMGNCGYTKDTAEQAIVAGDADMISFGRDYICNPDLVERIRNGADLTPLTDYSVLFATTGQEPSAKGYTDFPALA